jgi:phosphoribosylanthranilate isomerase
MPVRIKICGITRFEDARVAVSLGVDALGFIFHPPSPRYISPQAARRIIRELPPLVTKVGVFVNESAERIAEVVAQSGVDCVQLHGDETPDECECLQLPVIKAFSIAPGADLSVLDAYSVSAFLLDTWDGGLRGGTGRTFDWTLAEKAARTHDAVILAGGLGPTNIKEALDMVRPYGVDVNSGVEISPGVKNPQKMRDVVAIVKAWK